MSIQIYRGHIDEEQSHRFQFRLQLSEILRWEIYRWWLISWENIVPKQEIPFEPHEQQDDEDWCEFREVYHYINIVALIRVTQTTTLPKRTPDFLDETSLCSVITQFVRWTNTLDPSPWHYNLARFALAQDRDIEPEGLVVNLLAFEFHQRIKGLAEAIARLEAPTLDALSDLICQLIHNTGAQGEIAAQETRARLEQAYKRNGAAKWERWFKSVPHDTKYRNVERSRCTVDSSLIPTSCLNRDVISKLISMKMFLDAIERDIDQGRIERSWRTPWVETFVRALWHDHVKKRWQRAKSNPPGVTVPVLSQLTRLSNPKTTRTVEADAHQVSLFDDDGLLGQSEELAVHDIRFMKALIESGAQALQTTVGVQLWLGVIMEANKRIHEDGLVGAVPVLTYDSLEEMAEAMGIEYNKRKINQINQALSVGNNLKVTWPGGELHGLWLYSTYRKGKAGGGSTNCIEITPAPALLPNYCHRLSKHDGKQIIAPITPLGPLGNGKRSHKAEASFNLRITELLTERSIQIAEHGGVKIDAKDIGRAARELGTSPQTLENALNRWCEDSEDHPAVLEHVGQGRYIFANNEVYGRARQWLEAQGRLRKKNSDNAKRRNARKSSK